METTDSLGLALSGASSDSLRHYEQALHQLQCYSGDPFASIEAALAGSPDFVMGHVLHAWLLLLGTEPTALPAVRQDLARLAVLPGTPRERAHGRAIAAWADGRWRDAARLLEDLSIEHPLDALALQAGHVLDFYLGDARMLRDRVARALPAWSPGMPGYHALLGMHAFGLEENGDYARAESQGRAALTLEPHDAWAHHAVTHVMEMQGRVQEGIVWMRERQDEWATDNFFAMHNWWHFALFHLELGEVEQVLALFDGPMSGGRATLALDLIDASSLLWRLQLRGVALGGRWQAVAECWLPFADTAHYAFNDAHAMMAFIADGRIEAQQILLAAQQRAMAAEGDNAGITRAVGAPLVQALLAFGAGEWGRTVTLLRPLRGTAQRFGGSHAQRDLIDLTLVEAALRDGQQALARSLAAERIDAKPGSLSAWELLRRAG